MLNTPTLYSNQFKADVVTLVDPGIARRKMCADSGAFVLAKWTNEARLESFGMGPSVDAQTNKHISATLHRISEIEKENEVLRAEAAYSFQEVIHPKNLPDRHRVTTSRQATLSLTARVLGFSLRAYYKLHSRLFSDREHKNQQLFG